MLNTLWPLHEMMPATAHRPQGDCLCPGAPSPVPFRVYVTHMLAPAAGIAHLFCRGTRGLASERPVCVGSCMLTPLRKEQAHERHACVWPRRTGGSCRRHMTGAKGTALGARRQSCTRPGTCTTTCSSASTSSCPPSQSWSCNMSPGARASSGMVYNLEDTDARVGMITSQSI